MNTYYIYYGITFLALAVTLGAQAYVNSIYSKYSRIPNGAGMTGADAARDVLSRNGLYNVEIGTSQRYLGDHYDPRTKQVVLSANNYNSASVAAVAIGTHECGHALQDQQGYAFLKARSLILPLASFSSYAGYFSIMMGAFSGYFDLIRLGILMECVVLLFQVVTLPVEFDASRRALAEIQNSGYFTMEETEGARKVLTAAALTYVAAVASSLLEIFRLVLLFGNNSRRRR